MTTVTSPWSHRKVVSRICRTAAGRGEAFTVLQIYFLISAATMFCLCPQQVTADWSSPNLVTVSPEAFEVEPYCETPLAPFQIQGDLLTENATWLRKADGLSPQIHGPCLTPWQHEMNLTPRRLWNTKNILETFPVLDTTHMNTWKLSVTIATPWATAS